MDTTNNSTAPTQPAPAAPAQAQSAPSPAPTAPADLQAMIDAAVAQATAKVRDSVWREARLHYTGKDKAPDAAPPAANAQPSTTDPAAAVRAEVARMRAFERAAGSYVLSERGLAALEADLALANPPDPSAWVHERAESFGWAKRGAAPVTTAPTTATLQQAPTAPAAPMPGGVPAATQTTTADVPLLTMVRADPERVASLFQRDAAGTIKRLLTEMRDVRVPLR